MIKVVNFQDGQSGQFLGWSLFSMVKVVITQDGQGSQHTRMAKVVKAYKDSTEIQNY